MMETFERAGLDTDMGGNLFATFLAAGLPAPEMIAARCTEGGRRSRIARDREPLLAKPPRVTQDVARKNVIEFSMPAADLRLVRRVDMLSGFQDNPAMDPLDGIAAFARVVDGGSLSAAAQRPGISKSAVSAHVQRLEERLGIRLLNRSTCRLALTEAGAVSPPCADSR